MLSGARTCIAKVSGGGGESSKGAALWAGAVLAARRTVVRKIARDPISFMASDCNGGGYGMKRLRKKLK